MFKKEPPYDSWLRWMTQIGPLVIKVFIQHDRSKPGSHLVPGVHKSSAFHSLAWAISILTGVATAGRSCQHRLTMVVAVAQSTTI